MPVCQPFTFYGAQSWGSNLMFSGFPRLDAVDVTDYEFWVTLGGTQKGQTPTPEQIELSLHNAAKIYWMTYSVSATVYAESVFTSSISPGWSLSGGGDVLAISAEPSQRPIQEGASDFETTASGDLVAGGSVSFVGRIQRMFSDGVFVGYGTPSWVDSSASVGQHGFDSQAEDSFLFSSYVREVQEIPYDTTGSRSASYATLAGIPVVELRTQFGRSTSGEGWSETVTATATRPVVDCWTPPSL